MDYCSNTGDDIELCGCGECLEEAEFFQPDLDY
jgi:hypothetical protein